MINCEITSQITKKLDEIKADFNSQILQAIKSAITEKVFPILQNSLETQENGFGVGARVDLRSSGLHMNTEVEINRRTHQNCSNVNSNRKNRDRYRREISVGPQTRNFGHDNHQTKNL